MRQNAIQTAHARQRRQEQTPGEKVLWQMLRARRLGGLKVRRHVPIGPHIAGFYCSELKLVIEATESGHAEQDCSTRRDAWMRSEGIAVLRLSSRDILNDPAGCAVKILRAAGSRAS